MQLLSPEQVKKISRDVENADKRVLADLSIRVFEKTKDLNTLQANIDRNIKADQERQIERNQTIIALNDQIAALENERKRLLIPIDAIKNNLEMQLRDTLRLKHTLTQKEITIAEQRELILERMEQLTEWEQTLNERVATINQDTRTLDVERAEIKRISLGLQKQLQDYTVKIEEMNTHYQGKESQLEQGNYALKVKELTFARQQEEWENRKKAEERQLADQRTTLERALNRIKK